MQSTKSRIIEVAINRFNQDGLANVPMQQIAQDLDMSPGNLAYHFRTKNDLVSVIFNLISLEADTVMKQFRKYPNFLDFDLQLNKYFESIERLPFYFRDINEIERHYPSVMENRRKTIVDFFNQLVERFEYNNKRGVMKAELHEGQYYDMAETIWMITTFFATKVSLIHPNKEKMDKKIFMQKIWNYLLPYFTEDGMNEYKILIHPLISTPDK